METTFKTGNLKISADFSRPESTIQYTIVDDNIDEIWRCIPSQVADLGWPKRQAAIKAVREYLKDS